MKCPSCGSPHLSHRRAGEHAGGHLGALFGAAIGAAFAMRGVRTGVVAGAAFGGPVGAAAGGVAGAIATGIFTGSAASAIGSLFGHIADREILANRSCEVCGHAFRDSDAPSDARVSGPAANRKEATVDAAGEHGSVFHAPHHEH